VENLIDRNNGAHQARNRREEEERRKKPREQVLRRVKAEQGVTNKLHHPRQKSPVGGRGKYKKGEHLVCEGIGGEKGQSTKGI